MTGYDESAIPVAAVIVSHQQKGDAEALARQLGDAAVPIVVVVPYPFEGRCGDLNRKLAFVGLRSFHTSQALDEVGCM